MPTCTGQCAYLWPPLLAASQVQLSGNAQIVLRRDVFEQWAYGGQPLYRYAGDQNPGDAFGDGLLGGWHVIKQPRRAGSGLILAPSYSGEFGRSG